ncbi:MAG: TATA box binding protein-associated factor TAF9 [Amphiamblys sp. WSBS2006]|nr:MAG: TATA box binding protein-associated factor TAF9 [Amphiamblys sp. WSBS2006]
MSITRPCMRIVLSGTPGTGKTTIAKEICEVFSFRHINCSEYITANKLYSSIDEAYSTHVFDEDVFVESLKKEIENKSENIVFDFHSCDLLSEFEVDLVVVLRCDTDELYDRLETRGYSKEKIMENVSAEITGVCAEEAEESFQSETVFEFPNNTEEERQACVDFIRSKVECFL